MTRQLVAAVVFGGAILSAESPLGGENPYESTEHFPIVTEVDQLILGHQKRSPARAVLCSDAVFIRRAYLDVIGTLPTAQEAREFIENPDVRNKRRFLVDRLLERAEFADYWSMKWGDVLRIKAEFPVNLWPNAAQAYHRWVRDSLARNKPYDVFVRELLTSSGSNFRVGPVNFYRAVQNRTPEGIASAVSLTFMGVRTDSWSSNRLAGMAQFFSQVAYKPTREWKEEIVFWDPLKCPERDSKNTISTATNSYMQLAVAPLASDTVRQAIFPTGEAVQLLPGRDPREVFADWLITPGNPWFTRSIVNRVWHWLLGRGIIHEADDIREENPAAHPELLAYLERDLAESRYDLRRLYRLILNSQAYQLSTLSGMPHAGTEPVANDLGYQVRRLDAEVLIDAINKVTGASDLYTSAIPEPFTYIPSDRPAIALADGSITSPFLALFGRSARATGLLNERDNKPTPAQWLHLLNSTHVQRKIEQSSRLRKIINSKRAPEQIVEELYLTILSRFPTAAEICAVRDYGDDARTDSATQWDASRTREDWIDIVWALLNTTEFLYRH